MYFFYEVSLSTNQKNTYFIIRMGYYKDEGCKYVVISCKGLWMAVSRWQGWHWDRKVFLSFWEIRVNSRGTHEDESPREYRPDSGP